MIEGLISLMIFIVLVGLICYFLQWVMPKLNVPDMIQTIVWVVVALFAILAALGMFGYGPMQGGIPRH